MDSSVRRSLRIKKANNGFKVSTCADKNCLACDSAPPILSPSIIRNLGKTFRKLDADKISEEALRKKRTNVKEAIGVKSKKEPVQASSSENVGLDKAKSKKKNTEDVVAAPSGAKQVKPKNKENDQVSEAQKKAKK